MAKFLSSDTVQFAPKLPINNFTFAASSNTGGGVPSGTGVDRLSSDKKPVKIGDDVTGLLLSDNEVFVEKSPTQEDHIANKKYVDSFTYQFINCGYYGSATGNFIPINGYVIEKTSTSSSNEFVAFVAPYNGSVHKVMWRTEIAQNGDTIFGIHESADGTEVPALGVLQVHTAGGTAQAYSK